MNKLQRITWSFKNNTKLLLECGRTSKFKLNRSGKTSSIDQDIIYCAHKGQFITSKHILLLFAIKSMTADVKPINIINRHGVSYTKLAVVDTAYSILKISKNSGLIPEEIKPYQQAWMVYGNIDSFEKNTIWCKYNSHSKCNSYSKSFRWTQTPSKFDWHSRQSRKVYM